MFFFLQILSLPSAFCLPEFYIFTAVITKFFLKESDDITSVVQNFWTHRQMPFDTLMTSFLCAHDPFFARCEFLVKNTTIYVFLRFLIMFLTKCVLSSESTEWIFNSIFFSATTFL